VAEHDHVELQASCPAKREGATVERGAGREYVINENVSQGVI
jgi:hypothetical protein